MVQESKAEFCVAADAVESVCRDIGDDGDGVGTQVGKFLRLEAAPHLLGRVQVWGITGKRLGGQPVALAGDPFAHTSASVRRQAVPDQQHATLLEVAQLAQELDEAFVIVGARTELEDKVCSTA